MGEKAITIGGITREKFVHIFIGLLVTIAGPVIFLLIGNNFQLIFDIAYWISDELRVFVFFGFPGLISFIMYYLYSRSFINSLIVGIASSTILVIYILLYGQWVLP
jgi:hypothetical protein